MIKRLELEYHFLVLWVLFVIQYFVPLSLAGYLRFSLRSKGLDCPSNLWSITIIPPSPLPRPFPASFLNARLHCFLVVGLLAESNLIWCYLIFINLLNLILLYLALPYYIFWVASCVFFLSIHPSIYCIYIYIDCTYIYISNLHIYYLSICLSVCLSI